MDKLGLIHQSFILLELEEVQILEHVMCLQEKGLFIPVSPMEQSDRETPGASVEELRAISRMTKMVSQPISQNWGPGI